LGIFFINLNTNKKKTRCVNQIEDVSDGCLMHINLIPHTLENTTLQYLKAGSIVNLEVDLIARYVERMMSAQ
jgi:riboflavin synthase